MSFDWIGFCNAGNGSDNDARLPVSVILTTIATRHVFVRSFVIPSILANRPAELIVIDDENLDNQRKRNKGAARATQKYLFFCDDDVVMPVNHLEVLSGYLDLNQDCSFAYTDYQAIVMDPKTHPMSGNYYHKAIPFDLERLKFNNYIDTCSLVRKERFPGFDPDIKRFQDWDLWLTTALGGGKGIYVRETGIIKYYLDEGITSRSTDVSEMKKAVLKKHNLSGFVASLCVRIADENTSGDIFFKGFDLPGNGSYNVTYDFGGIKKAECLTLNPVIGEFCNIRIDKVVCKNKNGEYFDIDDALVTSNAQKNGQGFLQFRGSSHRVVIPCVDDISLVSFVGQFEYISREAAEQENRELAEQKARELAEQKARELAERNKKLRRRIMRILLRGKLRRFVINALS